MTIKYAVSGRGLPFSSTTLNLTAANRLSGLVNIGGRVVSVTTKVVYVSSAAGQSGVNTVNVVTDTNGVTKSGRSETNAVGGNSVTIGATGVDKATEETLSHEFGHVAGAGDQYLGGIDVSGNKLSADVPGPANLMKVLNQSSANDQTLKEIMEAKTNTNTCLKGVSAPTGKC